MDKKKLALAIHELNPWGGHDRSTLEIARRLSHFFPMDVFSYSIVDPSKRDAWAPFEFLQVKPFIKRPAISMISYFYLASLYQFGLLPLLKKQSRPLVHATGACSLVSDVIQVQFLNSAWKKIKSQLESTQGGLIKKIYHDFLLSYDIWVEKQVFKPHKTYIAISHQVEKELKDELGLTQNIHVIHHGVDLDVFRPLGESYELERKILRQGLGILPEEIVILLVGAYERKGLAYVIDAMGCLGAELRKKTWLLAIGKGDRSKFQHRAAKQNVSDRIVWIDHAKDIAPYYRASDVFLLPTLYEPFGLVILEAMACGVMPLVSKCSGGAELIQNDESGLLIENPQDAKEIASLLAKAIQNREMRKKLGQNARKVAEKRPWDQVAKEYASVIEPLLIKS